MGRIIGIDLGTTNSVAATMEGGTPVIIPNQFGHPTTPSVVAFSQEKQILVGDPAKNQSIVNSERTFRSIKRKMGTQERFHVDGREYTPDELSSLILRNLKQEAEAYLGESVSQAVITVPAYFNDNQRQATRNAGQIAGLEVLRIINEPTAAALAYGIRHKKDDARLLIYDLGGGTFDVSILEYSNGVFEVLATSGINHLGGDDFDALLQKAMIAQFAEENDIDLSRDRFAMQKLRDEAEQAKVALSNMMSINISIPFISAGIDGPIHFDQSYSRSELEDMIQPLVESTRAPVLGALKAAGLQPEEIDHTLLVGGSTRIPMVRDLVYDIMHKEPVGGVNPDECVALGAAIQGGVLSGELDDIVLVDVTALTLGIETQNNATTPVIPANSTIPTRKRKLFSTIADNQTTVEVHVVQGESSKVGDNISLGRFRLTGIRPAKKGEPRIEVSFDINVDGLVHVAARDMDTGNTQKIVIENAATLDPGEVKRLAKRSASQDSDSKDRLEEMRNTGKELMDKCRKAMDSVSSEERQIVNESLTLLREALLEEEPDKLATSIEDMKFLLDEMEL
jgi:molecular chaperone DnaK